MRAKTYVLLVIFSIFPLSALCAEDVYKSRLVLIGQGYNKDWTLDKSKLDQLRRITVKRHVAGVIRTLGIIAGRTKSLDSFGRSTMAQASEILDAGTPCVEFLSGNLSRRDLDWRVRYWIADILGYLKSEASARVLKKMMFDKNERKEVRKRAVQSLEQITG